MTAPHHPYWCPDRYTLRRPCADCVEDESLLPPPEVEGWVVFQPCLEGMVVLGQAGSESQARAMARAIEEERHGSATGDGR